MWFDIKKNAKGQYWWVAKGGNGETMCTSETYTAKSSAKHAIRVIKDGAADATVYDETGEAGVPSDRKISV